MKEPLILCIETALAAPSVALCCGEEVLSEITVEEKNKAAEQLHTIINVVCNQSDIEVNQLNAVAVSGGPGSYTGLRIGVSAAKGICYALNVPFIHIETMQVMHTMAKTMTQDVFNTCIALIDARRNDAFISIMDDLGDYIQTPEVVTIEANMFNHLIQAGKTVLIGNAVDKYVNSETSNLFRIHIKSITSGNMVFLAHKKFLADDFEDVAYYEPRYYKETFITKK